MLSANAIEREPAPKRRPRRRGWPTNKYLGIDPDDPRIEVIIHDEDGWLWASIAWTEGDDRLTAITGIELGEMGDLIASAGENTYVQLRLNSSIH
jgi:hypothetical protein